MGECFDSLGLDDGDERVECLCVTIRGNGNKADILVGVCYSYPTWMKMLMNYSVSWGFQLTSKLQS